MNNVDDALSIIWPMSWERMKAALMPRSDSLVRQGSLATSSHTATLHALGEEKKKSIYYYYSLCYL